MRRIVVYTDGGSRPNPGQSAYGMVYFVDGGRVGGHGDYLGEHHTNNYAEYWGAIHGLRRILAEMESLTDREGVEPTLYADSELVIKQLRGEYQCRKQHLIPLHRECRMLMRDIGERLKLVHVPRAYNGLADDLANRARDAQRRVTMEVAYSVADAKSVKRPRSTKSS